MVPQKGFLKDVVLIINCIDDSPYLPIVVVFVEGIEKDKALRKGQYSQ